MNQTTYPTVYKQLIWFNRYVSLNLKVHLFQVNTLLLIEYLQMKLCAVSRQQQFKHFSDACQPPLSI